MHRIMQSPMQSPSCRDAPHYAKSDAKSELPRCITLCKVRCKVRAAAMHHIMRSPMQSPSCRDAPHRANPTLEQGSASPRPDMTRRPRHRPSGASGPADGGRRARAMPASATHMGAGSAQPGAALHRARRRRGRGPRRPESLQEALSESLRVAPRAPERLLTRGPAGIWPVRPAAPL